VRSIISILIWIAGSILTILLFFGVLIATVLFFPFDRKKKIGHALCYWWAEAIIGLNPYWNLEVKGLENIDRRKTYVIVANHQSLGDIVVLYKIRMQFKWVAKETLFRLPFLGWNLSLIKHVKLTRGEFGSIRRIYHQIIKWLRSDMSVLFFPEGSRSDTDEMNKFQSGAFKLAIKEKKPILPIRIEGTRGAIPKGSWVFKTNVSGVITILPPIKTDGLKIGECENLRDVVFATLSET